ncbi:oxidation resistance protein 1-like [Electrophorus electricus]|uniref:TLDc domain-containing protein n=1 Tax=Electrophorus electricus TaxID=8005 RepID=A0A4W4FTK2_ELEEL|nr:oxidation resistance protein 1-like [Electrophorus electricus]
MDDEEIDDDEDFHHVEAQDEHVHRQTLDRECGTWDVPHLLGLQEIKSSLLCEPILSESSRLLTVSQIQQLRQHLPAALILNGWTMVYQTHTHGSSLNTLYRTASPLDHCMVLLVRDSYRQVFGAVCSAPLRISSSYYGTGQTFLFAFSPHLQVYKWTGINSYFLKGNNDSFLFGGGRGKFGLWLHGDLVRGRSQQCDTFSNETLSAVEDFLISELEVWALV